MDSGTSLPGLLAPSLSCVFPHICPLVSAGHCGLSLTQWRLGVMNNATGRLFLKAYHKASAFSGILLGNMGNRGAVQKPTKGGGEGGEMGE